MKLHLDLGFFCWQLISVVQQNLEHEAEDAPPEFVELGSETERIGFSRNEGDD